LEEVRLVLVSEVIEPLSEDNEEILPLVDERREILPLEEEILPKIAPPRTTKAAVDPLTISNELSIITDPPNPSDPPGKEIAN